MNEANIERAFNELFEWCRSRHFAGYDPFDALNSRIFAASPFRHSRTARLVWTQLIKRSPLNLRPLLLVPPQKNAKGTALFALAALANYRRLKTADAEQEARRLLNDLKQMQLGGYSGVAWGYNFDWQSRHFFAPQGTPTIVPTAFVGRAMVEAYESLGDREYLEIARSAGNFVLKDLKRPVDTQEELCFSYSPLDDTQVFNANLLAAETLASVGALTRETELCRLATRAVRYVVRRQRQDGSWAYGADAAQSWTDNFHTAFVLVSLKRVLKYCPGAEPDFERALQQGYRCWRESFFLADGWPKYYHDEPYPADAHAAATAIVSLVELQELDRTALPLAKTIAVWTIRNLRDRRGFFYYQRRRFYTVRTPFMRWSESWMLYALAQLLEEWHRL